MTVHQFFIKQSQIEPGRMVAIHGRDARHMSRVLRLKKGSKIKLVDETQQLYHGTVEKITGESVLVSLSEVALCAPEQARVSVVQGIPRLPKADLIVQKLTELGVGQVTFAHMDRSPYPDAFAKVTGRLQRLESIAESAAKQCGRLCIPRVLAAESLQEAVGGRGEAEVLLAASENSSGSSLRNALSGVGAASPIRIIVGPEGGFSENELRLLRLENVMEFSLGRNILRTETAAIVATAIVLYELGELE